MKFFLIIPFAMISMVAVGQSDIKNFHLKEKHLFWKCSDSTSTFTIQHRLKGNSWKVLTVLTTSTKDYKGLYQLPVDIRPTGSTYEYRIKSDKNQWSDVLSYTTFCAWGPTKYDKEINLIFKRKKGVLGADGKLVDASTDYEIFDSYGNKVKEGRATKIDIRGLKKGIYYLNTEEEMGEFIKK